MRKILKLTGYKIDGYSIAKNEKLNDFDCILCIIYAIISFINALMGIKSLKLVNFGDNGQIMIDIVSIKTFLLIIINAIVLIRLNIRLYMECKDKELDVFGTVQDDQKDVVTIRIKTLDRRMHLLYYCYVFDVAIFLINLLFLKNGIESSICILILVPICITLYNNLIDIAKRKYSVDEDIAYEFSTLEGVNMDDNISG